MKHAGTDKGIRLLDFDKVYKQTHQEERRGCLDV
jgi:hypothetical protein